MYWNLKRGVFLSQTNDGEILLKKAHRNYSKNVWPDVSAWSMSLMRENLCVYIFILLFAFFVCYKQIQCFLSQNRNGVGWTKSSSNRRCRYQLFLFYGHGVPGFSCIVDKELENHAGHLCPRLSLYCLLLVSNPVTWSAEVPCFHWVFIKNNVVLL